MRASTARDGCGCSHLYLNVKNAHMVKGVRRIATKMIPSMRNSSYDERLKRLGILSLRRRRLRSDMIEVFNMIYGTDKVNLGKLFLYRRG